MKLGVFDEERAKKEAVSYLAKSLTVLSSILDIDLDSFNPENANPYGTDSPFYASYECLREEFYAFGKLVNE